MQTRPIKRYRRFHGYDYGRGAAMFLTFSLSPRLPLFGRIRGEQMEFSEAGRIALEVIEHESRRTPDVQLKRFVVMPDHIHLRLYLQPGQEDPIRKMGKFVYNIKAWIRNHCKGRYLVLSRVAGPDTAAGVAWHGLNAALDDIAIATGGVGVYVRCDRGEMKWEFHRPGDSRRGLRAPAQDGGAS